MLLRLGTALSFIGLIFLVVFLITFGAERADLRVLLAGAGLAILGLALRRRGAPVRQESTRFVTMRKILRRGERPSEDIDPE